MKTLIKLVELESHLELYNRKEITLNRLTELLNECANENLST